MDSPEKLFRSGLAHLKTGQVYKGLRLLEAAGAEVLVHGSLARDPDQVRDYMHGDAHDRSKVQVLFEGKFHDV